MQRILEMTKQTVDADSLITRYEATLEAPIRNLVVQGSIRVYMQDSEQETIRLEVPTTVEPTGYVLRYSDLEKGTLNVFVDPEQFDGFPKGSAALYIPCPLVAYLRASGEAEVYADVLKHLYHVALHSGSVIHVASICPDFPSVKLNLDNSTVDISKLFADELTIKSTGHAKGTIRKILCDWLSCRTADHSSLSLEGIAFNASFELFDASRADAKYLLVEEGMCLTHGTSSLDCQVVKETSFVSPTSTLQNCFPEKTVISTAIRCATFREVPLADACEMILHLLPTTDTGPFHEMVLAYDCDLKSRIVYAPFMAKLCHCNEPEVILSGDSAASSMRLSLSCLTQEAIRQQLAEMLTTYARAAHADEQRVWVSVDPSVVDGCTLSEELQRVKDSPVLTFEFATEFS